MGSSKDTTTKSGLPRERETTHRTDTDGSRWKVKELRAPAGNP
jgi:hypothetical protein